MPDCAATAELLQTRVAGCPPPHPTHTDDRVLFPPTLLVTRSFVLLSLL